MIPLLIESNMMGLVDRILVIDVDLPLQLSRLCERDNMTVHDAQLIINNQVTRQQRLASADDVITNNNGLKSLKIQIDNLHNKYLSLANNPSSSCQHNDSHGQ